MMIPTGAPSPSSAASTLTRRRVLGVGGALGVVALAGCASAAASGGATASSSAAATASTGTTLGPGSVNVTFSSSTDSGPGGSASQQLSAAYLVDGIAATIDGGTWASTTADQNVFLVVNGGSLTLTNATITKTGDSSQEDACNFYGLNSAVLVVGDGSRATLTGCTVTTGAAGANAVFASSGGEVTTKGLTVTTTKDSSRGLDATYAGSITASDVTITTAGAHCACLATDRGNGTVTVTGTSTLAASGDGSPLVYSTGEISVTGATGAATGAQIMVIEGRNAITLDRCRFRTSGAEGMMIYQSFSGDAADADATAQKATMTIRNSALTSTTTRPMIYITNTDCEVAVTSSTLRHRSAAPLLSLAADRWGTTGSNGGTAAVTFRSCPALTGALAADDVSSATVALAKGSRLTGRTSGSVTVTADTSSRWTA